MTKSILKMFPGEAERQAAKLEAMASDYRALGDTVSASNCEAKARELRGLTP